MESTLGVTVNRLISDADVRCEAGSASGDVGVFCGVEQRNIDGRRDPGSVLAFCCGDPSQCPTWRLEVELRGEHTDVYKHTQKQRLQADAERAKRARLVEAQRLLQSTDAEARAFQARVKRVLAGRQG